MEAWAKLIEAVANLLGTLAWPAVVLVVALLFMGRYKAGIDKLIADIKSLTFPGGSIEWAATVAAKEAQVEELADQAANPEASEDERQEAVRALSKEAEQLGKIRARSGYFAVHCPNPHCGNEFFTRLRRIVACPNCGEAMSDSYLREQRARGLGATEDPNER